MSGIADHFQLDVGQLTKECKPLANSCEQDTGRHSELRGNDLEQRRVGCLARRQHATWMAQVAHLHGDAEAVVMLVNNCAGTSSSVIYASKIAQHFLVLGGCERVEDFAVLRAATTVGLHDRTAVDLLGIGEVRSTLEFKRVN